MYFTVLHRFKTLQDGFILPKMIHFFKKRLAKGILMRYNISRSHKCDLPL